MQFFNHNNGNFLHILHTPSFVQDLHIPRFPLFSLYSRNKLLSLLFEFVFFFLFSVFGSLSCCCCCCFYVCIYILLVDCMMYCCDDINLNRWSVVYILVLFFLFRYVDLIKIYKIFMISCEHEIPCHDIGILNDTLRHRTPFAIALNPNFSSFTQF